MREYTGRGKRALNGSGIRGVIQGRLYMYVLPGKFCYFVTVAVSASVLLV